MPQTKFLLDESQLPRHWYNIASDMPNPLLPVLHPGTGQPVGPDDLAPLFPMELINQEVSEEPEIAIPEEVLDIYSLWRPTPLYRARRLEQALGTRSRIFYKYEGASPAGSHKPNTAVAQAFYNKQEGRTRLSTETGAGQWGSALAFACKLIGLECKVYMVRDLVRPEAVPALDDPGVGRGDRRRARRRTRSAGRAILAEHPDSPGSLGIAISEAVEDAAGREDTAYSLGSVLNHVLLHQTVIGQEAIAQMELAGAFPDVVDRLRRRRLELRRARVPVPAREDRRPRHRLPRLRAGGLPDADARPLRLRLRRHGQADAARRRCTRSATTSCRRRSTPAACAITAPRRSSRSSCATG